MIQSWTGDQIRGAEAPLLADGQGPELMQRAARGLARTFQIAYNFALHCFSCFQWLA